MKIAEIPSEFKSFVTHWGSNAEQLQLEKEKESANVDP